MTFTSIIIFLSILFVLVVVHELGHFLLAKYYKMRVDEFAFGFPPRLLSKKIGETLYSFNLIPLGGYVKIFGENGMEEEDLKKLSDKDRGSLFGSYNPYRRIAVLSGGVIFNVIAAFVFFAISLMYGSNLFLTPEEAMATPHTSRDLLIVEINPQSPLLEAGLTPGSEILELSADGKTLSGQELTSASASTFVQTHPDSIIGITYLQNGETKVVNVVPKAGIVEGKKILGAKFADSAFKKFSFIESIGQAAKLTYDNLKFIFLGLFELIYNLIYKDARVEDSVSGPVGLAVLTSKVATQGTSEILFFAGLLSLSLAVFNILPIPALDGGRIVFVLWEIVTGKKVKSTIEQLFHGLGFLALIALMLFVTYYDIVKALN